MRLIRKLFLILLLFSCKKNNNYSSIQVIGHAGMGLEMSNSIYHNNSKEAIELALSMTGSNGVEIDVQQDLDRVLWLFHDENLDKTTNSTGCVAEKKTTELENIHYLSLHKEKLRKLAEIDFDKFADKIIFLDIKFWNACSENYASTSDIKNALKLINFENKENVYLIIPNESFLDGFKTDFKVLFANDNFEIGKNIIIQDSLIQGIVIRNSKINLDQVNSIRTFNRHVFLFEMRSPKGIKSALKKNPSGIISDDLRAAIIQKRN